MPINNPAGYLPAQVQDEYAALRQTQGQAIKQHEQFAQNLQQKQQQVQARQQDLTMSERMLRVLDPRVAKPAKQFLVRELAGVAGVDPKTEAFKNVSQMITSLDPDSQQALRNTLATTMKDAPPGKIQEIVKGIFTGQVPIHDLIGLVKSTQPQPMQIDGNGAGGETAAADGAPAGGPNLDRQEQSDPRVVQPFQEGGGSAVKSFEEGRTVLPGDQQVSPQLAGALGLDATKTFRNNDLVREGYRIPFDAKEQGELATSINTRAVGITSTIRDSALMMGLFEGRPEVLGPVGGFVRGVQSTIRQAEGLLRLIQPGVETNVDSNNSETRKLASDAAQRLAQAHGLDATAEDAARIESMVLGLAYRMAIARDIPGNRLTNAIINQHLVQIGQSASPEQFKAVLKDTVLSLTREFDDTMRRQIGVSGNEIIARQLPTEEIAFMAQNSDFLPPNMAGALADELEARKSEQREPAVEPSSPTIEEEQATLGRAEMAEKESKIAQRQFQNQLSLAQEVRARRAEKRAEAREERLIEQGEASMSLAREKFDYQKQQDAAAAQQAQQKRIADAFKSFGAAIANSFRGASIGTNVPSYRGQDQSAFRIAPAPQRIPPRIPGRGQ